MHKREIKEAFSQLHASDELVQEVIALKHEKKNDSRTWRIVARAAVCAAVVVAIVLTAVLWDGAEPGEQMGVPTVGTTVAPTLPTQVPTVPEMPTLPTETQGHELVKLSNVVKLYGCNAEKVNEKELEEYEITDVIAKYKVHWIEELDCYYGIRFMLHQPNELYENANIVFKLETFYGEFFVKDEKSGQRVSVGKTAQIGIGEIPAWHPESDLQNMKDNIDPGEIYLHIIIYADDHIVGFGLIEMASNYILERSFYAVTLRRFRAVSFPMVDGAYQDVTEEYIREQITEYEEIMREECNALREEMAKAPEGV